MNGPMCWLGARGRALRARPRAPYPCLAGWLNGWVACSLTSWLARSLAGWPNDGETYWRADWLSGWSGSDLEVLSGRAGPRPGAHACLAAVWRPSKRTGFVLTGWLASWLAGWEWSVEAIMGLGRIWPKSNGFVLTL